MKAIAQEVYDFMDRRLGIYVNPYNVEFILDEEDAISVNCSWPGAAVEAPFYIELEYDSNSLDEFITVFGITSLRHIGAIKPALLLELYEKGHAVIFSAINNSPFVYALRFRKQHDLLTVKEAHLAPIVVHETLEKPHDFIAYTLLHFQLAGKS